MAQTEFAQPANLPPSRSRWPNNSRIFGIRPDAVIGHSAGEVAAHHLAGLLTFEQAVEVVYHRSRLQQRTSGQGRMLAVGLDADALMRMLDETTLGEFGRRLSVAAINSPSAVTVAGDTELLDDGWPGSWTRPGSSTGIWWGRCRITTHFMDEIRTNSSVPSTGCPRKPRRSCSIRPSPVNGSTNTSRRRLLVAEHPGHGPVRTSDPPDAGGWLHPLRRIGPTPRPGRVDHRNRGPATRSVTASQRRDHDDGRTLLSCLGALHCTGQTVAWDAMQHRPGRLLKLPSHPWQTKRYWNETQEAVEALFYHPVHPLLGQKVNALHPTWEAELSTAFNPFLADHCVQGSVVVPSGLRGDGPGRGERGLRLEPQRRPPGAAPCRHPRRHLRPHSLRTTLNEDDGTLEFAAFTATPRRGAEVDDHRHRGTQHPSAAAASTGPAGRRRAHHRDQR